METDHKHTPIADVDVQFTMSFRTEAEIIKAGESVKFYFKPERVNRPGTVVPLTFLHERKIHLIIVSKDLSYFVHGHPEFTESGEYVWEHIFPAGGSYILFQDYMPTGAAQQLGRQEVQVAGEESTKSLPVEAVHHWKEDGYEVNLEPVGQVHIVDAAVMIKATVKKDGEPVHNLEKHLGSLSHVVIISQDTQDYLHVHAMASETLGPDVMLHTHFPKKGLYQVFMEFKHAGKVRLAIFTLEARDK